MGTTRRVAVLGGGVAGVVAAGELSRREDVAVDLFERAPELGGLQRSFVAEGAAYDIGAFLFGDDHELFAVFPGLLEQFVPVHPRHRSLTPAGSLDDYPSTLRGYLADHGPLALARAALRVVVAKARHRRRDTLPSLVRYYLGDDFYERSGFRTYIERLYGLPDHEIDVEFAARRLFFLQDVCSLRRRAWRGVRRVVAGERAAFHQPTVLVRPREGFGPVYAAVGDALRARGVRVRLGTAPTAIRKAGGAFELALPEGPAAYDHVVSTLPISTTARLIGEPLAEDLDYMKLVSLFYRLDGEARHGAAVVCNLTRTGRWKRLVDFAALYGPHEGATWFVVEVTTRDGGPDAVAAADADFRAHAAAHGLLAGTARLVGSRVTDHAYPVYRVRDAERVRAARRHLADWGIDLVGRQGRFEYAVSSLVARQARALADRIAEDHHAP